MDGPGNHIWQAVAQAFREQRGSAAHDRWLKDARPRSFSRGLFTLDVADADAKTALEASYHDELETIFKEITGSPVRVRVQVGDEQPVEPATGPRRRRRRRREDTVAAGRAAFVVTRSSELAQRAVERFARGDEGFACLLVHGPAGSGKTALARHAVNAVVDRDSGADPLVLSGEALSRDVVRASHARTFGKLQKEWADRDLIVLDEAHRLRGRQTAQAMAASLIGPALERGGRVLMLSRHAPDDMHGLGDRLQSYVRAGLAVALGVPLAADRRAILAAEAGALPGVTTVEPPVPTVLATRGPTNLTDAVDVLRRAGERAAGRDGRLGVDDLQSDLGRPSAAELGLDGLVLEVARRSGVAPERIRSPEKTRTVAAARHLAVYLATRSLGLSSRQVCRSLRLQSPSIVAYARRTVERKRSEDPDYDRLIVELQARFSGAQRDFAW